MRHFLYLIFLRIKIINNVIQYYKILLDLLRKISLEFNNCKKEDKGNLYKKKIYKQDIQFISIHDFFVNKTIAY